VKKIKIFFLISISLFLAGCATVPSVDVMKSEIQAFNLPKLPKDGSAIVYVVRPSVMGSLIRFNVFVDNQEAKSEVGFTRGSQYIYFDVMPGKRKILSKAENWAETEVDVSAGDIIFIQQVPEMGLIMARNSIFRIDDVQGKYNVKTLTLGTIGKSDK
jgi:hypothetical protein